MTKEEFMNEQREKYFPWMSDDQFECYKMLCDIFGGAHHVIGKVKAFGEGIMVNQRCLMSTFDPSRLTLAVVLAHDRCIRYEIAPSGPGMLRLILHKRKSREGRMYDRHPTLEDTVNKIRKSYENERVQQ